MTGRSRPKARGGKGGKEARPRVRLREIQVMERIIEGQTQHAIAAAVGISQPAVSKIVRRVEERLLSDLAWKAERQRARHTLRLEFIYREAIHAWQASQEESQRRRQRKAIAGGGGADGATIAEIVSEDQRGDPRFLEAARRALEDIRTLWGVDAPERLAIDAHTPFAHLSDDALAEEVARQRQLLADLETPSEVRPNPTTTPQEDADDDDESPPRSSAER